MTLPASSCIKCGFCMSVCPVYREDHMESHVARGRNVLILQAEANKIPAEDDYFQTLSHCLLCGRCLAVCPAKVPSPEINIKAREKQFEKKGPSFWQRLVFRGILKHRIAFARFLGMVSMIPGVTQENGKPLRHMADFMSVFSGGISIPKLSKPFLSNRLKALNLPHNKQSGKGRVAFFPGCGFDYFFSDIAVATAKAIANVGFEVVYPKNLSCCGMAVYNAGDSKTAVEMAKINIRILSGYDYIVTGCATCGSTLKNYGAWFKEDKELNEKAKTVSDKSCDFSQFLTQQGGTTLKYSGKTVRATYHDPCHLKWHQGISESPRQILNKLEGVEYVEMEGADACCGLGGTFSLSHRQLSLAILAKKMAAIKKTSAQIVVTSCPGCIIQLMDGVRRHGMDVEVKHISQMVEDGKEE